MWRNASLNEQAEFQIQPHPSQRQCHRRHVRQNRTLAWWFLAVVKVIM